MRKKHVKIKTTHGVQKNSKFFYTVAHETQLEDIKTDLSEIFDCFKVQSLLLHYVKVLLIKGISPLFLDSFLLFNLK